MADKVAESLETQRKQLKDLIGQRAELEAQLVSVVEGVNALRGSIAALEYVQTLNLVEGQPKVVDAEVVK